MKKRSVKLKSPTNVLSNTKNSSRRQDLRLHQHLLARLSANKEKRNRKRAEYLATLPKTRIKRTLYRMHPKRVARFVFSRDGLMFGLKAMGIGFALLAVSTFVIFAYYRKDLPKNITSLKACSSGQKTSYYDRTGEILLWRGEGDVDCRPVPLDQISPFLQNAVIATEDRTFRSNPGFDLKGTVRATLSNTAGSGGQQGGSTITQQYVKVAVLNDRGKKLSRKIKELILSVQLTSTYKKDEILQAYLNEVSLGQVYNGAESASQGFFGKSAKDLTLDEGATLAAAIKAPGYYWDKDRDALIARRNNTVLPSMVKMGFITQQQADEAVKVDTIAKVKEGKNKYGDIKAPHFVLEVQDRLEEELGTTNLRSQGYKVITTIDMGLQKAAEDAVANGMESVEGRGLDNAALVSEDVNTGEVVAYVGSRDFNYEGYGQKNLAGVPRSPGSSMKPYDYASLMANTQEYGAGSILYDVNTTFSGYGDPYKPTDYDLAQPGGISIRYALGGSRNIPATKAMYIAGIENTHNLIKKLGLYSGVQNCGIPCEQSLSTALGDGGEVRLDQHVHAYATFSRLGKVVPQLYVLKLLDSKGKVIRDYTKDTVPESAIDPQIAYIINDMLSDRAASYFRNSPSYRASVLGNYDDQTIPTAIKTGTTNNRENGWMMGYTPKYSTGVWIGHHEYKAATEPNMEYSTGRIWSDFMQVAMAGDPPAKWAQPEGVKTVAHDAAFFATIKSGCAGVRLGNVCGFGASDIYPGWYTPRKTTTTAQKVVIDTVSGKRATACTPDQARKELTSGGVLVPELPTSDPNYKNFMAPITARYRSSTGDSIPADGENDDVHSCSDVKPSISVSAPASCNGYCTISANLTRGTKPLKNVYFKLDGQVMSGGAFDVSESASSVNFNITPDFSGDHQITADIVDTALYTSTSAGVNVNFVGVTPITLNVSVAGVSPATIANLSWTNVYQAPYGSKSYAVFYTGPSSGSYTVAASSCSTSTCTSNKPRNNFGPPGSYNFYITSTSPDITSNTVPGTL